MFDSIKLNPKTVAKLGFAVTIIVSISACSSESIHSDGALIPPALNMPTSETHAAVAKAKHDIKRHWKKSRVAHSKAKKKTESGTSAARISKAEINGPSNPSAPAFTENLQTAENLIAIPSPDADQNVNFWVLWLAGVVFATGGLLWFALRRSSFGRGKPRRLIFNS